MPGAVGCDQLGLQLFGTVHHDLRSAHPGTELVPVELRECSVELDEVTSVARLVVTWAAGIIAPAGAD